MDKRDRETLRVARPYLVKNLSRMEELLDILEGERIVSEDERYRILAQATPADRIRTFLDILVRCGGLAYQNFLIALEQTNQSSVLEALDVSGAKVLSRATADATSSASPGTSSIPVTQNITESKPVKTVPFEPYQITSEPRGFVHIINIEKYEPAAGVSDRRGSSEDVLKLYSLFREFSYSVSVVHNLNGTQLENSVRDFAGKKEHADTHAAALFLLAHGSEHHIIASDGILVSVDTLASCFTNPNCPRLAGKPKLLVFQACRGEVRAQAIRIRKDLMDSAPSDHSLDPSSWLSLPYMSDCVIVYTTLPGFVSWRSETDGSWYISHFVDVFRAHGRNCHVMDLLAEVNHRLVDESTKMNIQQISQPVNTLRRPFYLSTTE
ncbi:Subfamily C14A unassigned peptidase (C14 family) [Fasciolopsis buskii]|uniref:Subfamily C14A unassigned peptidase (C14 family) n=1 Tax=Fasciolopsis buskii TaxID=27845 RepID=A0A8E0VH34_9TREM|nr:Subfamily C14A unassigned peptidase (C14 family) [Fasciolopsis buski]